MLRRYVVEAHDRATLERPPEGVLERGLRGLSRRIVKLAVQHGCARVVAIAARYGGIEPNPAAEALAGDDPPLLHAAIAQGDAPTVEVLLDEGADPDLAYGSRQWVPLMCVWTERTFEALLRSGARIDALEAENSHWWLANLHPRLITRLLAEGIDPNREDAEGQTRLYRMAEAGGAHAIAPLLRGGASPHRAARNGRGYTPLHIAAEKGYALTCLRLLEGGADPLRRTSDDLLPLNLAPRIPENITGCVLACYDVTKTEPDVDAAFQELVACLEGNTEETRRAIAWRQPSWSVRGAAWLLRCVRAYRDLDPLLLHRYLARPYLVACLLRAGLSPAPKDREGRTALYKAAEEGLAPTVVGLLQEGADPLATISGEEDFSRAGYTPLHIAAQKGHVAVCALLLGADGRCIDRPTDLGITPLDFAVRHQQWGVVQLFSSHLYPSSRAS
jgi:ankyrin repeat protein